VKFLPALTVAIIRKTTAKGILSVNCSGYTIGSQGPRVPQRAGATIWFREVLTSLEALGKIGAVSVKDISRHLRREPFFGDKIDGSIFFDGASERASSRQDSPQDNITNDHRRPRNPR